MNETSGEEYRSEEERQAALAFEQQDKEQTVETEKLRPFDAVIVLGAGIRDPLNRERENLAKSEGWMLPPDAKMRTIGAAQLYLDGLTKEIIFTGGRTATGRGLEVSEAEKMKEYAAQLLRERGVAPDKIDQIITLEDKATNTIENVANVCNIIDQNKDKYQNLAVLTNQYHLDRAQALLEKFGLKAQGISAEEKMLAHSEKYQKLLDKYFQSPGYQQRLAGERRWSAGLKDLPSYWFPQAMAVEDPDRLFEMMQSIYGPALAQKVGKEALLKSRDELKATKRAIPPEGWGEERKQ